MSKWKPLNYNKDIFGDEVDELLGIEELENPDDCAIVYGDKKRRKKRSKEVKANNQKKVKLKEKTNLQKTVFIKKKNSFKGFNHHEEMRSWCEFGLRDEILAALHDKKFLEPTEIQMKCLGPAVCGFRDILGAAETGSGKTLAFGIPIINGILQLKSQSNMGANSDECNIDEYNYKHKNDNIDCTKLMTLKSMREKNKLFGLILTPTRELAVQVKNHLTEICSYTDINIVLLVGGLSYEKQERLLKKRPEIIVATPGRLWDLIHSKNIYLQELNKLKYLAIDETDRMLEKAHFEELNKLLECINANEIDRKKRQNFVFSATLTVVHDPPSYLKGTNKQKITPGQKLQELMNRIGITNPKIIDITNSQVTPENLMEFKVICKFEEKDYYLHYFLKVNSGKKIIFCNSIGCVKRLANLLNILNYSPLPLHANMMQKQRLKNLDKFRETSNGILIATDVAARGLDILNVDHVLHYQLPKTAEIYVHRSGRTARRKNSGYVLLLIEPEEYKYYNKIMNTLKKSNEIQDISIDNNTLNYIKKVIHLTRDIDQLSLAIKRQNANTTWYSKALDEMDILIDEDELPSKVSDEAGRKIKQDLKFKKIQLKKLLQKKEVCQHFNGKFPMTEISNSLLLGEVIPNKINIFKRNKKNCSNKKLTIVS